MAREPVLLCVLIEPGEIIGLRSGKQPVQIGAGGVEKVIELPLSAKEKEELAVSASHVGELVAALDGVLKK